MQDILYFCIFLGFKMQDLKFILQKNAKNLRILRNILTFLQF